MVSGDLCYVALVVSMTDVVESKHLKALSILLVFFSELWVTARKPLGSTVYL